MNEIVVLEVLGTAVGLLVIVFLTVVLSSAIIAVDKRIDRWRRERDARRREDGQ